MSEDEIIRRVHHILNNTIHKSKIIMIPSIPVKDLGDSNIRKIFWKNIEEEFQLSIPFRVQKETETIDDIIDYVHYSLLEPLDFDIDGNPLPFSWKRHISPFQRWVLRASSMIGIILFAFGILITIWSSIHPSFQVYNFEIPADIGGYISGFGGFLTFQMFWAIDAGFERLQGGYLLHHFRHRTVFWMLILISFFIDGIGLSGILSLYGYDVIVLQAFGY